MRCGEPIGTYIYFGIYIMCIINTVSNDLLMKSTKVPPLAQFDRAEM